MKILKPFAYPTTALLLTVPAGCREAKDAHGHAHDGERSHSHDAGKDDHAPRHGGTPVLVAEDQFHLELVLDATAGRMQAYVLDGHVESYVQVPESSFVLVAKAGDKTEQSNFQRAPAPGSTTTPEMSSLFEAQSEWLKSVREFEGSIPTIALDGKTFSNIALRFPKGTKHVH